MDNLKAVAGDARYKFVQGDIASESDVQALLATEKPDAIINFAAESHVDRSITEPMEFLRTNVLGVQVLLAATKKHGVSRMIQISTDEAFGVNESGEFTEDSPLLPRSPYAVSKAAGEMLF
ncbi:GDP-mannose 4,6-dehydratase [Candidatus Uhrbacteria bacterium]|nr:GDP-mannose 4,6-dehydratase [Candidatus Uhrbacteria bacterium]